MTRLRPTIRRLPSLVGTALLAIAPPWALIRFIGWPLPRQQPDLDKMRQALEVGIDSAVLVNTLAVVVWIIWAQLFASLVVEAGAVLGRRPTRRLPVMPGMQALAARLVGGSLIVVSSLQAPASASPAVPAQAPITFVVTDPATAAAPTSPPTAPAPAAPLPRTTVQPYDSYWKIAERHLGDGMRWREIQALNIGQRMVDGTVISADGDLLRAGWVLLLPADAGPLPSVAPIASPAGEVQVQPGESLWTIASNAVGLQLGRTPTADEVRPYWQSVVDLNLDALSGGNPDLIQPGQLIVLPPGPGAAPSPPGPPEQSNPPEPPSGPPTSTEAPAPAPPPSTQPSPPPPTQPQPSTIPPAPTAPAAPDVAPHVETAGNPPPAVVIGGLVSAGIAISAVAAIRRRRRRHALLHPGSPPAPPTSEEDAPLHRALLAHADEPAAARLQAALASLARTFATDGRERRPRVVQMSDHHIDVLLDRGDCDPPTGWDMAAGGVWSATDSIAVDEEDFAHDVAPMLVTLGAPDEDGQMFIDLEAEHVVLLTGDEAVTADVARSIAVELILRGTATHTAVEVMVVGQATERDVAELGRVTFVDHWNDLDADLHARAEQCNDAVTSHGWPSTFAARAIDATHDALSPLVVIADQPPPASLVEVLRQHPNCPLAIVALGEEEAQGTVVRCEQDHLVLPSIGLQCAPHRLDESLIAPLARLVADDSDDIEAPDPVAVAEPQSDGETDEETDEEEDTPTPPVGIDAPTAHADGARAGVVALASSSPPPSPTDEVPDHDVLVRLLGDIIVQGVRGRPLSPKPTSVVAFLAIHREVSTEQLEAACWTEPGLTDHRRRLRDTMTRCRSALGADILPTATDGHYRAGPRLLTDLDIFDWHVHRASHLPPSEATAEYRAALALVTGRIFSYPAKASTSFTWIDVKNLVSQWEVRIAGVAQQCAATYLDAGQPSEAIEVLNRTSTALPLHCGLVELLMRAHARMGDTRAVRSTFAAYAASLEDHDLDVEESVLSLYRTLSGEVA